MSDKRHSPTASYLVCATPRSGSSLLTGLLKSSGVAGRPEEYFWRDDEAFWSGRWGTSTFPDYLHGALAEGTTPNGVFAAKVMWGYLDDLLGKLAALPSSSGPDDYQLLRRAFPALQFVFLWREDVVAQAVSLARAHQTNVWYRKEDSSPEVEASYDFGLIDGLLRMVTDHNTAWRRWFHDHEIEPCVVRYEDLCTDPAGATMRVLAFLGIDAASAQPIGAQTARQRDALNTEWIARYRAELAPPG